MQITKAISTSAENAGLTLTGPESQNGNLIFQYPTENLIKTQKSPFPLKNQRRWGKPDSVVRALELQATFLP